MKLITTTASGNEISKDIMPYHVSAKFGGISIDMSDYRANRNDHELMIPADELIEIAQKLVAQANRNSGNCPTKLKLIWQNN